ncbi:hypothetical protein EVAR_7053_1, partial [Eumeta japonica]
PDDARAADYRLAPVSIVVSILVAAPTPIQTPVTDVDVNNDIDIDSCRYSSRFYSNNQSKIALFHWWYATICLPEVFEEIRKNNDNAESFFIMTMLAVPSAVQRLNRRVIRRAKPIWNFKISISSQAEE